MCALDAVFGAAMMRRAYHAQPLSHVAWTDPQVDMQGNPWKESE